MSDTNKDIQPYINYEKHAGVHFRRPFASDHETRQHPPICGGDKLQPFVVVAEDGDVPSVLPFEAYCQRCVEVQEGGKE